MDKPFEDHGLFSWCELMTTDFEKSLEFYSNVLGWTLREVPGRNQSRYALVMNENSSEPFAGILTMPEPLKERGVPSFWQAYVTVEDVDETLEKALENGAQVVVEPMDIERIGRIASFRDPLGSVLSVIKYARK
ncbi:VOC family protein [Vibrio europaeus]|uniref:VOC family protein n=1 Tax=Vibrio europaeus TaxID=300876 RepID=UPI0023422D59|nr:VOC family protein [Vibrio europaeus]MDC5851870.1 VOC family protein [Vibrio europaeus]